MLTLGAPAKLNLTLEVLGKRPDGYHEIRSVFQAIDLCDELRFIPADEITITCDMKGWSAEKSLVSRAATLLREAAGGNLGASIEIEKRIPLMSGLGGDSSDAVAVLRGLDELWGLGLSRDKILEMATSLGSDVSFFLNGGTALAEEKGEKLTPLPPLKRAWFMVVLPDVPREPGKTAAMYQRLKPSHYTDGSITQRLVDALCKGEDVSPLLFNTFENVAFDDFTRSRVYVEHILKLGAPHVRLAGSGPALFTMFNDREQATELYTRCKDQGMEAYLAEAL